MKQNTTEEINEDKYIYHKKNDLALLIKNKNFRGVDMPGEVNIISFNATVVPFQYTNLVTEGVFYLTNFKV